MDHVRLVVTTFWSGGVNGNGETPIYLASGGGGGFGGWFKPTWSGYSAAKSFRNGGVGGRYSQEEVGMKEGLAEEVLNQWLGWGGGGGSDSGGGAGIHAGRWSRRRRWLL